MFDLVLMRRAAAAGLCLACTLAFAAPFTPANDSDIVERLPTSAGDPSVRRVESLRKQLAARPDDSALRLEIARRYFDLAMAQGDPRYVGYASAALGPLAKTAGNDANYWLVRGMIQQYSHDFAGALQSLARSRELNPESVDATSWRAASGNGPTPSRLQPRMRTPPAHPPGGAVLARKPKRPTSNQPASPPTWRLNW